MNHCGTISLETKRLILRRFVAEDAECSYKNWTSDEKVTEFLCWPTHSDVSVTQGVFDDWIKSYERSNFYQWAMVLKEEGDLIGTISAVKIKEHIKMVGIGYCIGSRWWNSGYTSEALTALIRFFFEEVKVNRIESQHDPKNLNSGKVMLKCGMKYEGTLRQADCSNKGIVDAAVYSILANEYGKKKM